MMKQINSARWENEDGDSFYKDDFGSYIVRTANGQFEIASSLERAYKVLDYLKCR